jgi:hypothetical protein
MLVDVLAVKETDKDNGIPVESNANAIITDSHAIIIPAALELPSGLVARGENQLSRPPR